MGAGCPFVACVRGAWSPPGFARPLRWPLLQPGRCGDGRVRPPRWRGRPCRVRTASAFSPAGTKTDSPGARSSSPAVGRGPPCRAGSAGWGGQVVGAAPSGQDVAGEAELVDRGLVDLLAVGEASGRRTPGSAGLEADDAQQFGDVDVLGGQSAAQHVVGVGHDLDAEAVRGRRAGRRRRGTGPRRAGVGRG